MAPVRAAGSASRTGRGQRRQVGRLGRRQVGKLCGGGPRGGGVTKTGPGQELNGEVEAVIVQGTPVASTGFERCASAWLVADDIGEERQFGLWTSSGVRPLAGCFAHPVSVRGGPALTSHSARIYIPRGLCPPPGRHVSSHCCCRCARQPVAQQLIGDARLIGPLLDPLEAWCGRCGRLGSGRPGPAFAGLDCPSSRSAGSHRFICVPGPGKIPAAFAANHV